MPHAQIWLQEARKLLGAGMRVAREWLTTAWEATRLATMLGREVLGLIPAPPCMSHSQAYGCVCWSQACRPHLGHWDSRSVTSLPQACFLCLMCCLLLAPSGKAWLVL